MSAPASPFAFNYTWPQAQRDLLAGATVAAISLPQAMAYALIAGVDPRFGLYSAIVVTVIASILGSSSHLINGPTNAISLVVFSALASFDGRFEAYEAMFLLGIMVGTIQILIAVFKLGDLTRYISESVVLGFMAGAGFLVAVGQIANFLGIKDKGNGHQAPLERLWHTLTESGPVNVYAVGLGLGTILLIILLRRVINKYKLPQMDMLLALITISTVAAFYGWSTPAPVDGKTVVSVVGNVPAALPSFHIPDIKFSWVKEMAGSSFAIAFLGLLEALAIAKSISSHTRQPLDYNRQCLAEGVANLTGGFFQALPGSGSLTRSAINYQAGAASRMSGVFAATIVAIAVVTLGPFAKFIPKSVLAGMLFITAARLIDWKRLRYAMRASHFDTGLILATAFAAVFISVEFSILIGVGISILLFVPRASKLSVRELVVTPEGVVRERLAEDGRAKSLRIYDFEGELFFGAAPELDRYFDEIKEATKRDGIRALVLRFRRTRNPDVVAIEHLEHFLRGMEKAGIPVLLTGIRPDMGRILSNLGFQDWLPPGRIFPEEEEKYSATLKAVKTARQILGEPAKRREEEDEVLYYLVR